MEPLFFEPDYQERVWGGNKLHTVLGKKIPFEHTGESWEISCHPNGHSTIISGEFSGMTLQEALLESGEMILGHPFTKDDKFPLLLKIIDAKEKLSVQVHPEDDYARIHENGELGKSEAWYILQANSGAKLVAGLKDGITKEIFSRYIQENRVEEALQELEVKAGDVLNIPAGLIHAIGDGILLAEIQQNSDTTYRVYDWGRVGLDGKPREMHVKQSLDVIDFEQKHSKELAKGISKEFDGYKITEFVRNKYFVLQELEIRSIYKQTDRKGYELYVCVEGNGFVEYEDSNRVVKTVAIERGKSFMIPSSLNAYSLYGNQGTIKLMKSFVEA